MLLWRSSFGLAVLTAMVLGFGFQSTPVTAQPPGRGPGAMGPEFIKDRDTFHFLLANRAAITRKVTRTEKGVETVTESDKPEVAAKIQEHVESMYRRVDTGQGIHLRDPLFYAIFRNAKKVTMKVEKTPRGMKVSESSDDPFVTKLIQAHAEVVSKFIANGHDEVRKNHEVPEGEAKR